MTPHFQAYDEKLNRDLIGNAFSKTPFLADTPSHVLDAVADYPFSTTCIQVTGKSNTASERRKKRP